MPDAVAAPPAGPFRPRIIAAAIELTARSGWSAVTMARLADAVGVSRQTVYNEVGTKPALAEAMVDNQLGRFLAVADEAFARHPDDLGTAIHAAVEGVLELARENTLLQAIASASHGAGNDLLPLLTTRADTLLTTARGVLTKHLAAYPVPLTEHELAVAVDVVIRVVLSHVMQPSDTPAHTAANLAWLASRVLRLDTSSR